MITPPQIIRSTIAPPPVIRSTLEIRQGPAGPPGGGGSGGSAPVTYPINGVASFNVNHTFGYVPEAMVLTQTGELVDTDIHFSEGSVTVVFSQPFTGALLLR